MEITELKDKLDNEFQKYYSVVVINGSWGIGKTFYLKNYLKNKEYIYVSLFGIDKLDDLRHAIYYELNKIGAKLNQFLKNNSNRDIGIFAVTLPIPNISSDIEKKLKKKLNDKNLILVIDDLERKSDNINTKELLGFIESLSEIENIKIIIVANEEKIKEIEVYNSFKEKVINKTYNITQYSEDAINVISKQLLDDNSIEKIISNDLFLNVIKDILSSHKIKNLRTLRKSILFTKIFLKQLDNEILKESDKIELIKICFAVVMEDCDNLYYKLVKDKSLEECILKYYFKDTFINGKLGLIRSIVNIYKEENTRVNYKIALDYFVGKYSVTTSEKDIFYCSEQEIEQRLIDFVNNNVKSINNKIDINVWFNELNNLYPWAEKINKPQIFKEKEIIFAMNKYVEKINIQDNLYSILDRTLPFHITHENMGKYYNILKYKIAIYYFSKLIDKIKLSMESNVYDDKLLEDLFGTLTNSLLVDNATRVKIIKIIEKNDFFIPNINDDISEEQWHWCHIIWERCSVMMDETIKGKLYRVSQKLIKKYTIIGKYRINSLNNHYSIINDNKN